MLTKDDLQQIRQVVKEEVNSEIKPLKTVILKTQSQVGSMQNQIGSIQGQIGTIQSQTNSMQVQIKTVQKDIVQIRKDQKIIVNFFDREYLDLRKRVERIEDHLKLHSKN